MNRLARHDERLRKLHGARFVGGIDEAGRGALAGPVVVAAVTLGPGAELEGVDDSKALTRERREELAPAILARAVSAEIALATAAEVDQLNVLRATLLGARRALDALSHPPDYLVTDYLKLPDPPCPILPIARGDSTSLAVAAASVLAKVARDRLMQRLATEYPEYGFERHKGYGTAAHWAALEEAGPSSIHRLTFQGVGWFNAEPAVWSVTLREGKLPARRPRGDLLALVRGEVVPIAAFLPEIEYGRGGTG